MKRVEKAKIIYQSLGNKICLNKAEKGLYFNQIMKAIETIEKKQKTLGMKD